MCYKIINNYICTQVVTLFTFSSTKQTSCYSRKSRVSSVRDGHSFLKRIDNVWNSLPESVVMSKSVTDFRHQVNVTLSCLLWERNMTCFLFVFLVHSLVFLWAHVSAASLPLSPAGTLSYISYVW